MTGRIGILGGTFDPMHRGHVDIGLAAEHALALTEIVVVPSHLPPHRPQTAASSFHRFAMVALSLGGRKNWRVSDLELLRNEPSYTSSTLSQLHAAGYDPTELFFIIGADAFAEVGTWKDYPAVLDKAHFVVVSRASHRVDAVRRQLPGLAGRMAEPGEVAVTGNRTLILLIDATTADVSSTAIRQQLADGEPVTGWVTPEVERYIAQQKLYAATTTATMNDVTRAAGRLHGHK